MDKQTMVRKTAKDVGITVAQANQCTEIFLDWLRSEIAGGGLTIEGFGFFQVKVRAPKTIRPVNSLDPTAKMEVGAGVQITLKPHESLKKQVLENNPWNGNEKKKS